MELITTKQFRLECKAIWSDLQFIVLSDTAFEIWKLGEFEAWLNTNRTDIFIDRLFECEEHAMRLVAIQREQQAREIIAKGLQTQDWYNKALGRVWGANLEGAGSHFANVIRDHDGIKLVEPQPGGGIWAPERGNKYHKVDFLEM